jgi:hypothetical protein
MVVAVGAVNGTWRSFTGLGMVRQGDEAVAFLSAGAGSYFRADPIVPSDLRGAIATFIHENGDMKVAVFEGGHLHEHVDLNVDQDVGDDGDDINVMIVQAYVMKASSVPRQP